MLCSPKHEIRNLADVHTRGQKISDRRCSNWVQRAKERQKVSIYGEATQLNESNLLNKKSLKAVSARVQRIGVLGTLTPTVYLQKLTFHLSVIAFK